MELSCNVDTKIIKETHLSSKQATTKKRGETNIFKCFQGRNVKCVMPHWFKRRNRPVKALFLHMPSLHKSVTSYTYILTDTNLKSHTQIKYLEDDPPKYSSRIFLPEVVVVLLVMAKDGLKGRRGGLI